MTGLILDQCGPIQLRNIVKYCQIHQSTKALSPLGMILFHWEVKCFIFRLSIQIEPWHNCTCLEATFQLRILSLSSSKWGIAPDTFSPESVRSFRACHFSTLTKRVHWVIFMSSPPPRFCLRFKIFLVFWKKYFGRNLTRICGRYVWIRAWNFLHYFTSLLNAWNGMYISGTSFTNFEIHEHPITVFIIFRGKSCLILLTDSPNTTSKKLGTPGPGFTMSSQS